MDEKIRTAIRKIAGNGSTQAQVCEVVSVNTNSRTAKVVFNGVEYDVQLAPAIGDQLLQIPEAGSTVFVINGIIVGYSDLSELWLRGNQFDGLVRVSELVQKLNDLENRVNLIQFTFNAHVHASSGSPAVPIVTDPPLIPTQQIQIENQNVKHG